MEGASVAIIILIACYFIPTIIALSRGHKDAAAIIAVNLFLGWSVIGWFISFVWSLSDARGRNATQTVVINTAQHNVVLPQAAKPTAFAALPSHATDQDTAFWDALPGKSDPDSLEEYLIRFPDGRFAQLARNRLARSGNSTVVLASPSPANAIASACPSCIPEWESGSKFCSTCGASAPAS